LKETKIYCDGCGQWLTSNEVAFNGQVWFNQHPEIHLCEGCASLVCREVFNQFFEENKENTEFWKQTPYETLLALRDKLVLWAKEKMMKWSY